MKSAYLQKKPLFFSTFTLHPYQKAQPILSMKKTFAHSLTKTKLNRNRLIRFRIMVA